MTPEQIVETVGMLGLAFGRRIESETFDVYEFALADLDVEDHRAVVKRVLRTMERWPSPAALRKAILDQFGLLAPDEDQAWEMAFAFATSRRTEGLDSLPYPVVEAYKVVGGSWSIKTGDRAVTHAQFREAYRRAKERADRATLEMSWNGLALTPGGGRHGRAEQALPG